MWRALIILSASLLVTGICRATDIFGNVSGVWNASNNPYNVTGNVTVPPESTLVIQPGCQVIFQGHYIFKVDSAAILQAVGNHADSIIFTAQDTLEGWRGILLYHTSPNTLFRYCEFEYCMYDTVHSAGATTINSTYSYLDIKNCSFHNCGKGTFAGVVLSLYDPLAVIDSCLFKGNSSDYTLIFIITGNFTISNCRFENNVVPSLIYNDGASYVSVIGNAFRYNIGAIFVNNHGLHFRFSGNLIIENSASDDFEYFIIVIDGITTMENNTICNNNALGRHLIILGDEHSYPDMYFNNNIVWDNSVTGSMTFGDNMPLQAIYNDIEGGWPGTGNTNSNPKFVNPDSGDYNLSWANWPIDDSTKSPCIDTGDPNSPLDPDSTRADMGALFYNQRWNDIPDNQRLPDRFILLDNYPNPFNFSTTIRYIVPTTGPVTLDVYDILGRKVRTLLDINQPAGEYRVTWNADKVGTGVYFYRLTTGSNSISRPMILLK
jgi:hypothetical protein